MLARRPGRVWSSNRAFGRFCCEVSTAWPSTCHGTFELLCASPPSWQISWTPEPDPEPVLPTLGNSAGSRSGPSETGGSEGPNQLIPVVARIDGRVQNKSWEYLWGIFRCFTALWPLPFGWSVGSATRVALVLKKPLNFVMLLRRGMKKSFETHADARKICVVDGSGLQSRRRIPFEIPSDWCNRTFEDVFFVCQILVDQGKVKALLHIQTLKHIETVSCLWLCVPNLNRSQTLWSRHLGCWVFSSGGGDSVSKFQDLKP